MGIDEQFTGEIVRRILAAAKAERIILFGSAASGQMTEDSDIDLLILEEAPGNVFEESAKVSSSLRGLGLPFDVIVMSTNHFEETKNVIGGIAYPAAKYGKIIYEAP